MAKSADVTIITKWGSRAPTMGEIVKGELAVDLIKQILYTNDGNQIIEVGGGSVDWSQINPDTIPPELIAIIDGVINLDDLLELAGNNADEIIRLNNELAALAARVSQNEKDIGTNAGNILTNTADIAANNALILANKSAIADNTADIVDIEGNLITMDGRITQNEDDILALQKVVDGDLTGLYLGGTYKLPDNKVEDVTAAGTSAGINAGDTLDQHAKESNKGMYFVIEGSGTLGGLFRDSSNGQQGQNGDWLVCDGVHGWILMSFGGDHVAWGSIGGSIENQTDLMEELDKKVEEGDTLDGGRF